MLSPRDCEFPKRFCEIAHWFHPFPVPGLPKNPHQWSWLFDRAPSACIMAVVIEPNDGELSLLVGSDLDDRIKYVYAPRQETYADPTCLNALEFWWSLLAESPKAHERGIGPALVRNAQKLLSAGISNGNTVIFRIEDKPQYQYRRYQMIVGGDYVIDQEQTETHKEY